MKCHTKKGLEGQEMMRYIVLDDSLQWHSATLQLPARFFHHFQTARMRKRLDNRVDALLGSRHALDSDEQGELVDAFQKLQVEQAGEWRCLWGCIIGVDLALPLQSLCY